MADEQELTLGADAAIAEGGQEIPPVQYSDEGGEDAPHEEIAGGEEVAAEAAPEFVQQHSPSMAKIWETLTPEAKYAYLEDLTANLSSVAEPQKGDLADGNEGGDTPLADPAESAAPGAIAPPSSMTPEQMDTVLTGIVGDDPDAKARLMPLLELMNKTVQYASRVGDATLTVAKGTDKQVRSFADERAFERALLANESLFSGLDDNAYLAVQREAQAIRKAGRTANWNDAIQLALVQHERANRKPASSPGTVARRSVAGSLSSGGRAVRPTTRPIARNFDDALENALQRMPK